MAIGQRAARLPAHSRKRRAKRRSYAKPVTEGEREVKHAMPEVCGGRDEMHGKSSYQGRQAAEHRDNGASTGPIF